MLRTLTGRAIDEWLKAMGIVRFDHDIRRIGLEIKLGEPDRLLWCKFGRRQREGQGES